jgi:hypothetical protein
MRKRKRAGADFRKSSWASVNAARAWTLAVMREQKRAADVDHKKTGGVDFD